MRFIQLNTLNEFGIVIQNILLVYASFLNFISQISNKCYGLMLSHFYRNNNDRNDFFRSCFLLERTHTDLETKLQSEILNNILENE